MDTQNRESLFADAATPITIDQEYRFSWPTFPHDYVFKAGNQIGIVLVANYQSIGINGTTGATVTLDTKTSKVSLPIVGGAGAAAASGAFDPDTTAPTFDPIEDVAAETADPGGAAVTYPLPTATDTQDPAPVVDLRAAVRLAVRDRQHDGQLHRAGRQRQLVDRQLRGDAGVDRRGRRRRRWRRAADAEPHARRGGLVRRLHARPGARLLRDAGGERDLDGGAARCSPSPTRARPPPGTWSTGRSRCPRRSRQRRRAPAARAATTRPSAARRCRRSC